MAGHIPNDLLIDILSRLPVASLLRFRSVCKSWCSLITSPGFVTKHLNQSITNSKRKGDKLLAIVSTYENDWKEERCLLLCDDENLGLFMELEFPFKRYVGYFRIVACCNGLVLCLCHVHFSVNPQVILWNPSIRKSVTLRPIPSDPRCEHMVVYGIGAHPTTHKYKVVRIVYKREVPKYDYEIPPKAEIYEQGTSSWRDVTPPYYIVNFVNSISQEFLNGAVHWVAYDRCEDGSPRNLIISFNVASELFSEITLPPTLADQLLLSISIKLFGESLAILCNRGRDGGVGSIWVMKEYGVAESWTKLFSSNLLGMPHKALGFRRNGEVLVASANNYSLSSYVPETKTLRDTGIRGISCASYVGPFIETLILPEEINGTSQGQALLPTPEERRE